MKLTAKTSTLGMAVLLAFGIAGTANAQECSMGDWDTDANAELTNDEFTAGIESDDWFGAWDANEDGLLDENEFGVATSGWGLDNEMLWNDWNEDDGVLEDDPLSDGLFDVADRDRNEMLNCDEYNWFAGLDA